MREAVLEMMQTLVRAVEEADACADQLGAIASDARAEGDDQIAPVMLTLSRGHRIRALELRGRLAAFSVAHGGIFDQEL